MTYKKIRLKSKPSWILMTLCLLLTLLAFNALPAHAVEASPQRQVRIGIKFNSITDATSVLTSTSGFKLVTVDGAGAFTDTGATLPLNTLYVIKNTKAVGETIGTPAGSSGAYFGPYHLQVGPNFGTYLEMRQFLDQTSIQLQNLFPAYDDGWKVYVGAYQSEAEREVKRAEIETVLPNLELIPAPVNDKAIMIVDNTSIFMYYDTGDSVFALLPQSSGDLIGFESRKYRGAIGVQRFTDSDPTIINYIGVEPYLYGVLPREMSGEWPLEALKAQAVAARNYAYASFGKHSKWGFDLCNLQDCQVYGGASVERPRSNDAVDETWGRLLVYDNKPITAFFHSNSGGRTENSEYVWSAVTPYLKSVDDPYSLGQPSATWSKTYTTAQVDEILKSKNINIGPLIGIYITKVSPNGRALETVFVGRDGDYVASKEKARYILGTYDIRSSWYTIEGGGSVLPGSSGEVTLESAGGKTAVPVDRLVVESAGGQVSLGSSEMTMLTASGVSTFKPSGSVATPGSGSSTIVFKGYGFGHGVGMSQWGAKAMADLGMSYEQILTHYYVNTRIQ
jgi:stage II sporulation protein D